MLFAGTLVVSAEQKNVASREQFPLGPEAPVIGNPTGDVTIVEWFDYQCSYCKTLSPELEKIIKDDGHVRLVLRDWPILGPPSPDVSRLVLATRYQGKFEAAHRAVMVRVGRLTMSVVDETLAAAGVDVTRAKADLKRHRAEIEALLARNNEQAREFGFSVVPSFFIGTIRVPGSLEPDDLKRVIADVRAKAKQDNKVAPAETENGK